MLGTERPPAHPDLPRTGELFREEVDRAVERQGGARAVDDRSDGHFAARREARHAAFEDYHQHDPQNPERSNAPPLSDAPPPLAEEADALAVPHPVTEESGPQESPTAVPVQGPPANVDRGPGQAAHPGPVPSQVAAGQPGVPTGSAASTAAPAAVPAPAAVSASASPAALPVVNGVGRNPVSGAALPQAPESVPAPADPLPLERAAEILQQIRVALAPGMRSATVHLSPAELGRLSIRVRLEGGRLSALVRAESPATLELLEKHAPELFSMLSDQGIETGSFELEQSFGESSRHEERAPVLRAISAAPAQQAPAPEPDLHTEDTHLPDSSGVDTYA